MPLRKDQFAAEISAQDIIDLCTNHDAEDISLEFKQNLFTFPGRAPDVQAKLLDDQIEDTLSDIVAFANAFGGHIIVGIADTLSRAERIAPLSAENATRIAQVIRDRAAVFIRPRLPLLESVPFPMDARQQDWTVVVTIPPGESRPYLSSFRDQTRFTIRDGNRKRAMTAEEIREAILAAPQSTAIAGILSEIRVLRALIEERYSPDQDLKGTKRRSWKQILQKYWN
ncbi:MAG: ATP-binding protein [Candidatus Angelobacter sp.]